MNLLENIREGLRSIKANRLRTILTSTIIAIGIMALVGILTAIEGIQSAVNNSFSGLGANSFDIRNRDVFKIRREGETEKNFPPINFHQAKMYKERFSSMATVGLKTNVSFNAELKYNSKKTNPTSRLMGTDENYMAMRNFIIAQGRTFSVNELSSAANVCVIGVDLVTSLFGKNINPLEKEVSIMGQKCKVIGILEKKGSFMGGGDDRVVFVPLETGRKLSNGQSLTFDIITATAKVEDVDRTMEEARGIMRIVRQDKIGAEESFKIQRADSLIKQSESITGMLRAGGFLIGFITLLGAAIALMNIMMVSVTERTREIGIRKSLGATPYLIRLQFLLEAIVICILGGVGGIVLAIPIGNLISQGLMQGKASFVIPWMLMFLGIFICVFVGVLSGFYPAYKASKLDPIDALRYE